MDHVVYVPDHDPLKCVLNRLRVATAVHVVTPSRSFPGNGLGRVARTPISSPNPQAHSHKTRPSRLLVGTPSFWGLSEWFPDPRLLIREVLIQENGCTCSPPRTVQLSSRCITVSSRDGKYCESYRTVHHSRNTMVSCATDHCGSDGSSV